MKNAWLIQRRCPQEPTAYWGSADRWVLRRHVNGIKDAGKERVPEGALIVYDYDAAFQLAEWLRANQPLAYGEVIAVIPHPEST